MEEREREREEAKRVSRRLLFAERRYELFNRCSFDGVLPWPLIQFSRSTIEIG